MTIDYLNPVAIAGNAIIFLAHYIFDYMLLTPRMKAWKVLLFSFPFAAVTYCITAFTPSEYMAVRGIVAFLIGYILPAIPFYSDSILRRICVPCVSIAACIIAEMVASLYWTQSPGVSYLIPYSISVATSVLLLVIFGAVYFNLIKKSEDRLSEREWIIMLLIPFSQYLSMLGWLRYYWYTSTLSNANREALIPICVLTAMVILADYLLVKSIRRTVSAAALKAENAALASQISVQEKYYSALESQFAANRKIRHDISNHLYTIKSLLSDGRHEEAEKYAGEYLAGVSSSLPPQLGEEPSVNAFLAYKQDALKSHGIGTSFDVSLPRGTGISPVDLVTVLGNLLDNAEEACSGIDSPLIRLTIRKQDDMIFIREENPYIEQKEHKERISGLSRGTGYMILSNIAEKYNGAFTHENADGTYRGAVSLKVNS